MFRRITLFLLILLASGAACFECTSFARSADENAKTIAVIVNADNPVAALTRGELQAILLGERQTWGGKVPIVLMMRTYGSPEREIVVQKICRMNQAEYHQYWNTKIFRGEASVEPVTLPSVGAALNFVSSVKGGLSFVTAGSVSAKFNGENRADRWPPAGRTRLPSSVNSTSKKSNAEFTAFINSGHTLITT